MNRHVLTKNIVVADFQPGWLIVIVTVLGTLPVQRPIVDRLDDVAWLDIGDRAGPPTQGVCRLKWPSPPTTCYPVSDR
jgi:hypothetical protein